MSIQTNRVNKITTFYSKDLQFILQFAANGCLSDDK